MPGAATTAVDGSGEQVAVSLGPVADLQALIETPHPFAVFLPPPHPVAGFQVPPPGLSLEMPNDAHGIRRKHDEDRERNAAQQAGHKEGEVRVHSTGCQPRRSLRTMASHRSWGRRSA